jgi:cytochrome c peroxidase
MQVINTLKRQVPSLYNLAYSKVFTWDGREKNLESIVLKPIANHEEMNQDFNRMISIMNQNKELKAEFKLVFGTDTIYTALVSRALAQYIRSLVFTNNGPKKGNGKVLFERHCSKCHEGKFTTDFKIRKSVIAASGPDSGMFRISRKPSELFLFKTPSLAKIKLTHPYMHNGSYQSLKEVVMGYSNYLKIEELDSEDAQIELVSYLETL